MQALSRGSRSHEPNGEQRSAKTEKEVTWGAFQVRNSGSAAQTFSCSLYGHIILDVIKRRVGVHRKSKRCVVGYIPLVGSGQDRIQAHSSLPVAKNQRAALHRVALY